jgi:hypothetical protein
MNKETAVVVMSGFNRTPVHIPFSHYQFWNEGTIVILNACIYSKTKDYYFHAEDLATSYPCLEMCPKERIGVLDFYSYVFNGTETNRERGVAREAEAGFDLENEIRNIEPYKEINNIG